MVEWLTPDVAGFQFIAQTALWSWEFVLEALPTLLDGLYVTVRISLLAGGIALLLGLVLAVLRLSRIQIVSTGVAHTVEFIRSTPVLVQLYFVFYVLPQYGLRLSAFVTGVGVLGLHYATYLSEVYRAGINGVPEGQWDAATALNLSPVRTWVSVILPQAIPPMIPTMGNYLNEMFKATPILLAITVVELLARAQAVGSQTFRYLEPLTLAGALYLIVSLATSVLVAWMERRFPPIGAGKAT